MTPCHPGADHKSRGLNPDWYPPCFFSFFSPPMNTSIIQWTLSHLLNWSASSLKSFISSLIFFFYCLPSIKCAYWNNHGHEKHKWIPLQRICCVVSKCIIVKIVQSLRQIWNDPVNQWNTLVCVYFLSIFLLFFPPSLLSLTLLCFLQLTSWQSIAFSVKRSWQNTKGLLKQ